MSVLIFVEGKEDKEFLGAYLRYLGYPEANIEVCNGNHLSDDHLSLMEQKRDFGGKVLLIFDADKNYQTTLNRLLEESHQLLQQDEIFLFPNNSNLGELETLLFSIASYPKIHQCFKKYKNEICAIDPKYCNNIHKKSARYAYFEALGLLKVKGTDRQNAYPTVFDFQDKALDPLKNFLDKHK